jgi:hypothetical protein
MKVSRTVFLETYFLQYILYEDAVGNIRAIFYKIGSWSKLEACTVYIPSNVYSELRYSNILLCQLELGND